MELINPLAQAYAEKYSSRNDLFLNELEQKAAAHPQANMLSGHLQGKFLEMLSVLTKPLYILEIGSFLGFSALCLVKGLQKGGELHTIELREDVAATARENFKKANTADKIILHTGNALEIIRGLNKAWDLVFIDADKTGYADYYRLLLPTLKSGCLLIADNVLFHGEVLEKEISGKNAKAIHDFNEMVSADESVEKVMLTIRDGLLLIRKK